MMRKLERADKGKFKKILLSIALLSGIVTFSNSYSTPAALNKPATMPLAGSLKDSVDQKTGLIIAPGFAVVSTTCVRCHSPKLITAKRATREGWLATIRWMQQTQGLWDLGPQEPVILDYLAKNYAPTNEGRRPLLKTTEWYKLNN
jgi:hypothetical protein